jgi:transposase
MRYELLDDEWATIKPMLPDKARGVPRVDDRRVLNRIFWVLRSGALRPSAWTGTGPTEWLSELFADDPSAA